MVKKRFFAILAVVVCLAVGSLPVFMPSGRNESSSTVRFSGTSDVEVVEGKVDLEGLRLVDPAATHPVMPEGEYEKTVDLGLRSRAANPIVPNAKPVLGSETTWHLENPTPEKQVKTYEFRLFAVESVVDNMANLEAVFADVEKTENQLTYTIREPGEYFVDCVVRYTDGSSITPYVFFTVDEKSGVETVSSRVDAIASECRQALGANADEYAVALWLHDWVTHHSVYDRTLRYHGADSILFYGTGVCDSYSKLYMLLMHKMGMECERQTGRFGAESHAWNVAKINGVWCQIDPTWDDPPVSANDSVVSNYENHDYFGLTDELMKLDHTYTGTRTCDSLANCYDCRNKTYLTWFGHIWNDIASAMNSAKLSFSISNEGIVLIDANSGYADKEPVDRYSTVAVACMNENDWYMLRHPVDPVFSYDANSQIVHYEIDLGEPQVQLPAGTRVIEASAFEGATSVVTVGLQDNATTIGNGAFTGCSNLFWVRIPDSVTSIDPNAFKGLSKRGYMIVCNEGSVAEQYCKSNGIVACTG